MRPPDGVGFPGPVNIGSEEMVTINQMAEMIMENRREEIDNQARLRPHWCARPQFRQCADSREARLGAVDAAAARIGQDVRVD